MRMQSGRLIWRTTFLVSILSFLLFAVGFAFALDPTVLRSASNTGPLVPEKTPSPSGQPGQDGMFHVVALGDSLTRGVGDANGLGYIGLVRAKLEKEQGQKLVVNNLAINGLQSPSLLSQLEQPQVKRLIAGADLILFTIGGNDLFQQSGGIYDLEQKKTAAIINSLATNYTKILTRLRSLNPDARIVYTSLYNPFGDTQAARETSLPVITWNSRASELAARIPDTIVVPTYDLFWQKEKTYLYTDHFHPNSEGYRRMAERIIQALE